MQHIGLSELIFDSAVQKERLIQQTLKERQLEAFRVYRQTLLESAVAHKIEANDHNVNVQHLKNQVQSSFLLESTVLITSFIYRFNS